MSKEVEKTVEPQVEQEVQQNQEAVVEQKLILSRYNTSKGVFMLETIQR